MAYTPASVTTGTSGINHLVAAAYDRVAVENFKAHTPFYAACERKVLPERSGKVLQIFTYDALTSNTTPGTEGAVGTGIAPSTAVRTVTIAQYFDFMSFSDVLVETALDDIVVNSAAEMSYRAALSVNALTASEFDTAFASSFTIDLADNEFFSASIARQAVMSLRGANVKPKADGMFVGIIHPFAAYDLINDNTAGGVLDTLKHVESGVAELRRGIQGYRVLELSGVRWIETTTVPTSSNFPSSGKTGYHTYVLGMNAIYAVSLGRTAVPGERNFRLIVNSDLPESAADPAGVIRSTVAYNFKYAAIRRPGTAMAGRRVRAEASIS